jgi:hypothetical protein
VLFYLSYLINFVSFRFLLSKIFCWVEIKFVFYQNFINLYAQLQPLFFVISLSKNQSNMRTKINYGKFAGMLACFTVISLASFAQKSMTVSGEVVDMACYMSKGAHGDGHKDCATMCINQGSPMGVLTSDGKVYLLVENHDKPDAYSQAKKNAGVQVTVTGDFFERSGIQSLVVSDVKAKS